MKEIVIISGKGGTGKTVITGAFAALAKNRVMVDCDVDAADLHLLLHPEIKEKYEFRSGFTALINEETCIKCGKCQNICRFNAVKDEFVIDPIACEGCAFCSHICPVNAIEMQENISGEWYISKTNYGSFVHAKLGIAEENSGKLVALIRQKARNLAAWQSVDWLISDGPPGVGCAVIAAIVGATLAIIVAEPTLSGIHDFKRIVALTKKLNLTTKVIINKYDINLENTQNIKDICKEQQISCVGQIPYSKEVLMAVTNGKTIIEHLPQNEVSIELQRIWAIIQ